MYQKIHGRVGPMKEQINPSLTSQLKQELLCYAQKRRIPYSQVVSAALEAYFDPDSAQINQKILYARLDKLNRQVLQLTQDVEVLSEAFVLYAKNHLARMPAIAAENLETFKHNKEVQFEAFIQAVANSLSQGKNLINRLPRQSFVDAAEAEQVLADIALDEAQYE